MDADGYIRIVDRKKDNGPTSRAFQRLPQRESRNVLAAHPPCLEAAVIGVPEEATGEARQAFHRSSDPALTEAQRCAALCQGTP